MQEYTKKRTESDVKSAIFEVLTAALLMTQSPGVWRSVGRGVSDVSKNRIVFSFTLKTKVYYI
jgi:hypothetical protein